MRPLPSDPVLFTLASRQIWPQVLGVLHLRPARLVLLHSADRLESKGPAQRLKRFFDKNDLLPKGGTTMEEIPYDDFEGILRRLDSLEADPARSLLHFTGGNKLMAMAAFRWAIRRAIPCFYWERGNRLTWFFGRGEEVETDSAGVDVGIADALDPLDLLRCQIDASEVERNGELLRLNTQGARIPLEELSARCARGEDLRGLLSIAERSEGDRQEKEGNRLEYNAAVVLLRLGVRCVRRSLRLKVKSGTGISTSRPHEEIDLLFNHGGRLWQVDCKDRKPPEQLAEELEARLRRKNVLPCPDIASLLERIRSELTIQQVKALKLDLLSVQDSGGLLGRTVCVRRVPMAEEVEQYARQKGIDVVLASELVDGLRALLDPGRSATPGELSDLQRRFARP
ncbi:conserved protein of unknown function [Methylacidimicrobium sp. AP8]|uniref:hypothetical protein n=1 Tax=Methylacidimicrobium sp. AP8 TaxID=2730359 RepID=UPI0018C04610|nr:hypothetical protein [Methylacidimicrobium sp. AP8]CAB4243094.1 conserved protein of unknown function [Methylacidimicrobium sp. AP8]